MLMQRNQVKTKTHLFSIRQVEVGSELVYTRMHGVDKRITTVWRVYRIVKRNDGSRAVFMANATRPRIKDVRNLETLARSPNWELIVG